MNFRRMFVVAKANKVLVIGTTNNLINSGPVIRTECIPNRPSSICTDSLSLSGTAAHDVQCKANIRTNVYTDEDIHSQRDRTR